MRRAVVLELVRELWQNERSPARAGFCLDFFCYLFLSRKKVNKEYFKKTTWIVSITLLYSPREYTNKRQSPNP
jgi:hypothetical protein